MPSAKLDVNGEVKFGLTAGLPCNASTEGQQRYNSTTKNMEFCNGTTWTAFGGASFYRTVSYRGYGAGGFTSGEPGGAAYYLSGSTDGWRTGGSGYPGGGGTGGWSGGANTPGADGLVIVEELL